MKILIIGDSHTGALNRGLNELKKTGGIASDIRIRPLGGGHLLPTPFYRDAGDHAEIVDPEYRKSFQRLPPAGPPLDAIGLSMPLWPMRLMHQMNWGKWSLSDAVEGRRPISHAVFRQMVLADQKYVLGFTDLLRRNGQRVFAVSAPGLFRDHNSLRKMPPDHGLKIFRTYREIITQELRDRDVAIIDIPPECLDDDGFMRAEFRHEDPADEHHANARFGVLMIERAEAWTRSLA